MKYDEKMNCKFKITAPSNHVIHIDLEKISAQKLLINNETMNSPEIGRLSYVDNVEIFVTYEKMIRYGDLKFPRSMSANLKDLLTGLLRRSPGKRLGSTPGEEGAR